MEKTFNKQLNSLGFTLIELLLVISILGVLTGVLVNVLDIGKTKGKARDGVRFSNMEKLVQAIEAMGAAEGSYNITKLASGGELSSTADLSDVAKVYIKEWPQPTGDDTRKYFYKGDKSNFNLFVEMESGGDSYPTCLKYSPNAGKLMHCKRESSCNNSNKFNDTCEVF